MTKTSILRAEKTKHLKSLRPPRPLCSNKYAAVIEFPTKKLAQIIADFKVVRNKKLNFFSHRYLIEFYETNRMSHVPHLYDVVEVLK